LIMSKTYGKFDITKDDMDIIANMAYTVDGGVWYLGDFIEYRDGRLEPVIKLMVNLNEIIDAGTVPGYLEERIYNEIRWRSDVKHMERLKEAIIDDLKEHGIGVKVRHRTPKLYEQLIDPSTRKFDMSHVDDFTFKVIDGNNRIISVGDTIEYYDPNKDEDGIDGVVIRIQSSGRDSDDAIIDVRWDGADHDDRSIETANEPIPYFRLVTTAGNKSVASCPPGKPIVVHRGDSEFCRAKPTPKPHTYVFYYQVKVTDYPSTGEWHVESGQQEIIDTTVIKATKQFTKWLFGSYVARPNRYSLVSVDGVDIPMAERKDVDYKWNERP